MASTASGNRPGSSACTVTGDRRPRLVLLPFAFAPAVGALVVRRWVTLEGFRDAGLRLELRRCWRSYLVAWPAPLEEMVPGLPGWAFVALLMLVIPLLAPVYWGEEFGWTGYLRSRILPGR